MIFALSQAKWIPIQYKKLLQMQFSAKIKTSNIYDPEHQVLFHCSENFIFSFMREWTHAIQFNDLNELLFKFKDFILKLIRKPKCVSTSILKWQNLHFNWMSLNSISSRYLTLCKVHPNSKICKLSTMQFSASRLYQDGYIDGIDQWEHWIVSK